MSYLIRLDVFGGLLNSTASKITSFLNLKDGWRYGEGKAFSNEIIHAAKLLNSTAIKAGFYETDAFPERDGGISVALYDENNYYEFRIKSDDSIRFIHERNDEPVDEPVSLELQSAVNQIKRLKESQWNTFFTSISAIMTDDWEGSGQQRFTTPVTVAESPLFQRNVFTTPLEVYAVTQNVSIPPASINQLYSGNLNRMICSPGATWNKKQATPETPAIIT